jgi:hypothetical protein
MLWLWETHLHVHFKNIYNTRCNNSEKKKINVPKRIDFLPIQILEDSGENERNKVRFCDGNGKRFVWKVSRNLMEKTIKNS